MNDLYVAADQVVVGDRIPIDGAWHTVMELREKAPGTLYGIHHPINFRVEPPTKTGLEIFGFSADDMVRVRPTPDRVEGHPYR